MRGLKPTVLLIAVFVLSVPSPAQAWLGWLDNLSGPGKFIGAQWGFRLICFGEESDEKRLVSGMKKANALTQKISWVVVDQVDKVNAVIRVAKKDPTEAARTKVGSTMTESQDAVRRSVAEATEAWRETMIGIQNTLLSFPMLDDAAAKTYFRSVADQLDALHKLELPGKSVATGDNSTSLSEITTQEQDKLVKDVSAAMDGLNRAFRLAITPIDRGTSAPNGSGVFLSVCSNDSIRRASLDIMADFWHTGGEAQYADNKRIVLTMVIPEFSMRLFADPRWDFVDVGVGAGVYWFTSAGFDSFHGLVLEPVFFDLRMPSRWNAANMDRNWRHWAPRLAAGITFRAGVTTFPSGFAPNAFAGVGPANVRLPAEGLLSMSLFYNIAPFVRRPPSVKPGALVP
jgi:hypothetical protein